MEKVKLQNPVFVVMGGLLTLSVVMGVGRFAYTPILPLMQQEVGFSDTVAGYMASINFLGYLVGALMGTMKCFKQERVFFLRIFLGLSILFTLLMGTSELFSFWLLLRLGAGLTSGLVFVIVSSTVLDYLSTKELSNWSGFLYSGVGIGIFLTGIGVPVLHLYTGWHGAWIGLAIISVLFYCLIITWIPKNVDEKPTPAYKATPKKESAQKKSASTPILPWLIAAYGLEGLGYIVSGTFLVAIVTQIPGFTAHPSLSWAFVGAAAAPSCILWIKAGSRFGELTTLKTAYLLQIVGVLLPVLSPGAAGVLLGALLFGGTFMGITALSLSMGRRLSQGDSGRIIGLMTFVYGVGQMIGPTVAGMMADSTGSYNSALYFASLALFVAFLLLVFGKLKDSYAANSSTVDTPHS